MTDLDFKDQSAVRAESLTDAQTERQDLVDNAIHNLLNELAAASGVAHHGPHVVEWNMEHIGDVREVVQTILVDRLHLMSEMEFYPYIEPQSALDRAMEKVDVPQE